MTCLKRRNKIQGSRYHYEPWRGYVVKCENKINAKNGYQILENVKIRKYFMLSKTFNVANEMNRHRKKYFAKLFWSMVHQRGFNTI